MQSGQLRHRVSIQHLSGSVSDGVGNVRQTWTDVYTDIPASIEPIASRELYAAEKTETKNSHKITIRYMDGINSKMRVVFGSRMFNIDGILNKDERNISLEMVCAEQV